MTADRHAAESGHKLTAAQTPLVEIMPMKLLDEPLEYLFADHFRQRSVLSCLRKFADTKEILPSYSSEIIGFLTHELPLHHADEELDLFPAVLRRAKPEDAIEPVLERLQEEHEASDAETMRIVGILSECAASESHMLGRKAINMLKAFAVSVNTHLAIENSLVLAIARVRLSAKDLTAISRGMKARRGVAFT